MFTQSPKKGSKSLSSTYSISVFLEIEKLSEVIPPLEIAREMTNAYLSKKSIATSKWLSPKYTHHVLLFFYLKFAVIVGGSEDLIWRKHSWFFVNFRMCIPQENILACRKICQQIFGLKKMKPSRKFTRATMGQFLNRFKKT